MLISVFTPTYNRAKLIYRVFDSLQGQDFRDFEWIIIDDGSTDNTSNIVEGFIEEASFPIRYYRQDNQGKVAAINYGLDLARGELFICFDSDDWCRKHAFSTIAMEWESLGKDDRDSFCGISCLKILSDGTLVGEDYSRMKRSGESYLDRFNRRIKGDKWEILRTDLHRQARYDLAPGERYMAPEYAWLKLGRSYKTLFLNDALSIVEYQADGISLNNLANRMSNPISATRFYKLAWSISDNWVSRLRSAINLMRFAFHAKESSDLPVFARSIAIVPGWLSFQKDRVILRLRNRQRVK